MDEVKITKADVLRWFDDLPMFSIRPEPKEDASPKVQYRGQRARFDPIPGVINSA